MQGNTDQKNSEYGHFSRSTYFPRKDRIFDSSILRETRILTYFAQWLLLCTQPSAYFGH